MQETRYCAQCGAPLAGVDGCASCASQTPAGPVLVVRQPLGRVERLTLSQGDLTIGRRADNAIVLDDPSASTTHALLRSTPAGWSVTDLGSRNGIAVNGRPVRG